MIDNDQSTIIEAPDVYKSIPTHSPTAKPTTEYTWEKNVYFDTFDAHEKLVHKIICLATDVNDRIVVVPIGW
jgi:hypothetical protein